jgi:hypothetical protein
MWSLKTEKPGWWYGGRLVPLFRRRPAVVLETEGDFAADDQGFAVVADFSEQEVWQVVIVAGWAAGDFWEAVAVAHQRISTQVPVASPIGMAQAQAPGHSAEWPQKVGMQAVQRAELVGSAAQRATAARAVIPRAMRRFRMVASW